MTTIESKHVSLNCSADEAFEYLSDMNNFEELLPRDKISNFQSDNTQCSFKVQGTATIALVQKELKPVGEINIVSGEKSPFPFTLDIHIKTNDGGCEAYQVFNGDINPFLKMMVEKPLANLFNYIADRLQKVKS
jgi:hypothetical protein